MSVVDLHPEELFDKLAQGRLSDAEHARLDAHLATCVACRFELEARRDCAEIPPDILAAAPVIIPDPSAARRSSPDLSPPVAVRRGRRPLWVLALAAALIAGVSLAAVNPRVRALVARWPSITADSGKPAHRRAASEPQAPSQPARVESPANTDATEAVKLGDLPLANEAPRANESRATSQAQPTPAALFRSANEARRAGDDERAIALYHSLEAQFPNSEEARLSHATLGRLMLDRGDAKMALDDFDKYLSHGGSLGEEALVGRALALGKLGNRDAEAAAWRDVLRRFPKSIHARQARTRLAALDEQ